MPRVVYTGALIKKKIMAKNKNKAFKGSNVFIAKWKNEITGEDVTRKVRFISPSVRLRDSSVVDSDLLVKLANTGKLSKEESDDNPILANLMQEDAVKWLTDLTLMRYGYLEQA